MARPPRTENLDERAGAGASPGAAAGERAPPDGGGPAIEASVVVPVRNEERHIESALAAMRRQQLDGPIELLLVDGRSEDGTPEILERLRRDDPRIRIVDNPARTTAAGLNAGLRAARGRYVARMDAHAYYPERYLRSGIERLRRGDGVVWVAGTQVARGDGVWSRRVALALTAGWLGRGDGARRWSPAAGGEPREEFPLATSVFTGVWRRDYLIAIGGWDDGWPVNQDSEMAARVLELGGRIVCRPEMAAVYVPRDSLAALARQYGGYGFYRAKTLVRHRTSLRRSRLLTLGVVGALAGSALPVRGLRGASRAASAVYACTLVLASARAARAPGVARGDARMLPVVLATMHVAWGSGFAAGLLVHGPRARRLRGWPAPARPARAAEGPA